MACTRARSQRTKTCKPPASAHAPGEYAIALVDVCQRPEVVREKNLVALPSLLGDLPPPLRKIVGDLANLDEVIGFLSKSDGSS